VEPETVYQISVDLAGTANVFLSGHRIRLEISSSSFPRHDRNPNTGGAFAETLAEMVTVTNRVHHGPAYPSHLVLPIIDR
jgi:putative CocE/NonD family hydrolase